MHPSLSKLVVLPLFFLLHRVSAHLDLHDSFSSLEWPTYDHHHQDSAVSVSYDSGSVSAGEDWLSDDEVEQRRWLYWRRIHYYISYAAMSANHIPCRPRSGRSYYNHDCSHLSGAVHPYFRSCSAITRCRR